MNIHLPAILGFTRYRGFDPSIDCHRLAPLAQKSIRGKKHLPQQTLPGLHQVHLRIQFPYLRCVTCNVMQPRIEKLVGSSWLCQNGQTSNSDPISSYFPRIESSLKHRPTAAATNAGLFFQRVALCAFSFLGVSRHEKVAMPMRWQDMSVSWKLTKGIKGHPEMRHAVHLNIADASCPWTSHPLWDKSGLLSPSKSRRSDVCTISTENIASLCNDKLF